jgi:hypothetical protein
LIRNISKKASLERKTAISKACKSLKADPSKWLNCREDKWEEINASGDIRGTEAYMDKHYSSLSLTEAESKLEELKELFILAGKNKRFSMNAKPEKGELNVDLLKAEIRYLKRAVKENDAPKLGLAERAEVLGANQMSDRIRKLTVPVDK